MNIKHHIGRYIGRILVTAALSLSALVGHAQTATTTVLTSSTNPQVVGQSSTLTATVTPAAATGSVTFRDGSTTIGTGTLSAGVATLVRTFPTAGTRSLTAIYAGGGGYTTSTSAALSQVVSKAPSTTTLVSSANPASVGSITLTATVVGYGTATGTITFRNGTATLGSPVTLASGSASLTVSTLGIGTHNLTAAYGGNTNNATSTSTVLVQNVNGAALPPAPVASAPVINYEYDAQGNPTKTVQAPGQAGFGFENKASYDPLQRVKDTTDPKNGITRYGYNGREEVTQVTDPRNLITSYPRDGLGQATQLVSPDTGTASHTYDAAGNLKTRTDSRGALATHTYDALNRLTRTVYSQSGQTSLTYNWAYDQTGTSYANGIGRLTSTSHPTGSTTYKYDAQGRLTSDIQRVLAATGANTATITKTVTYQYDPAGNLIGLVYPSGRKLTLTYTDGQLTGLGLGTSATATPTALISQLQFEPFGGPKSWQWQLGSGTTQAYERSYDTSGRLIRYRLGNTVRDLSYDAADRITAYTHYDATTAAPQANLNQGFGYDENGRLTTITTATASWTIGYDANGNRTGVTLNGTPSVYTTAATSNRLTSTTNPARSFGYDTAGNTTSDSANYTATYDTSGRLATITKAGVTTTYSYNAQGQRVRKFSSTGAASTVLFVYDQGGQLLGEYNSAGTVLREYVWMGNTPIAMFTPNGSSAPLVYYFHTDHLNTPRVATDTAGNIRWRWLAEPFGTTVAEDNPSALGAITQNLRFPGQYLDQETGLHYNYFRDYDSSIGRYAQSDPIGLAGGINTYSYVENNPLSYVDPNGLFRTQNGHYTPFRPRPRFPNPSMPRPAHDQGNPWLDAAGFFNDEGQFVCMRWKCEGADMCFQDGYDRRGRSRRATDFLPAQTDPQNPPEGCVCDDPRFMPKGMPSLWDEKDWADLYGKWRTRPR